MSASSLASNVYGSGSPYAATLTGSSPAVLTGSKIGETATVASLEGAAAGGYGAKIAGAGASLTSATTAAGSGVAAGNGAGIGTGICKLAAGGLAGAGTTLVGAVITGGLGFLAGYLAYKGVSKFVS